MADEIDNDDVAVLGHEPPMSERDKFLFDNFARTINAHKKANNNNNNNNNAPPQLPNLGEEGAGEKNHGCVKKLEEAIPSITPKSTIETNFDLENMDLPLPDTDNEIDVEKSIVLIPLKGEEEEADQVEEVSTNKVVRPKKDYPTDKRIMLLVVLVAFSIYFGIAASFYFG